MGDLYHVMHKGGAKFEEIKLLLDALGVSVELPAEDFLKVSGDGKKAIKERVENKGQIMVKLVSCMEEKGYSRVINYTNNARHLMFGCVRRCLK